MRSAFPIRNLQSAFRNRIIPQSAMRAQLSQFISARQMPQDQNDLYASAWLAVTFSIDTFGRRRVFQ
jgi:hypothetical protein